MNSSSSCYAYAVGVVLGDGLEEDILLAFHSTLSESRAVLNRLAESFVDVCLSNDDSWLCEDEVGAAVAETLGSGACGHGQLRTFRTTCLLSARALSTALSPVNYHLQTPMQRFCRV